MSSDTSSDVKTSQIDLNAEIRKIWAQKWNEPTVEYVFSSGREFKRQTEDAGIYQQP